MPRIWKFLRLLKLPKPIQDHLRGERAPERLRYFTVNRLMTLIHIRDPRAAWRRFRKMLAEAEQNTGIWKKRAR